MTEIKNDEKIDSPETRMLASLQKLEVFVDSTSQDMVAHIKALKENNQILKSTAYNMSKIPAETQEHIRISVFKEYEKMLPQMRQDFREDCEMHSTFVREQTTQVEKIVEKATTLHRIILRNLMVVGLVSALGAIGGTWGALKLFKAHTSISTAETVTTSGPIHLFDVSGRHISSVLDHQQK